MTVGISLIISFNVNSQIQIQDELFQTKRDKTFYEIQREFYNYWAPYNVDKDGYYYQNSKKQKAPYWKQFKRWEYYWENRVDPVTGLDTLPQQISTAADNWYVLPHSEVRPGTIYKMSMNTFIQLFVQYIFRKRRGAIAWKTLK